MMTASGPFFSAIGTPKLAMPVGRAARIIIECIRAGSKTRQAARFELISERSRNFFCGDRLEHSHMRTKARFSRWLKAVAILAVAK
jgi:hypothetical protein